MSGPSIEYRERVRVAADAARGTRSARPSLLAALLAGTVGILAGAFVLNFTDLVPQQAEPSTSTGFDGKPAALADHAAVTAVVRAADRAEHIGRFG